MTEEKPKHIKLYAYDIENSDINKSHSDLKAKLTQKLTVENETAGQRRLVLNEESREEDLLSSFAITNILVFGVMWRIIPKKEVPNIPDELFEHEKIDFGEIVDGEGKTLLTCKDRYYFSINNNFLVTNLPKSRIRALEVYLNWLLHATRGNNQYKFTPKIEAPKGISLKDIKNITFIDPRNQDTESTEGAKKEQKNSKVINFAKEHLLPLLKEVPDLDELIKKDILSAQLYLKFKKPRKMTDDDYKKLLGAYMKPISDADGVKLQLKNGKRIKGADLLLTKDVDIEKLEIGISEPDLFLKMEEFLEELNKTL